jgi:hypothetical protein
MSWKLASQCCESMFLNDFGVSQCCESMFLSHFGVSQCCESMFPSHFRVSQCCESMFLNHFGVSQCCESIFLNHFVVSQRCESIFSVNLNSWKSFNPENPGSDVLLFWKSCKFHKFWFRQQALSRYMFLWHSADGVRDATQTLVDEVRKAFLWMQTAFVNKYRNFLTACQG